MGLYDRDYTRGGEAYGRSGRSGGGGLFRGHSATTVLIAINAAVFLLWLAAKGHFDALMWDHFTVSANGVLKHGRVHTLLTSAFSHFGLWHLLWNMLFLHWFGSELEEGIYGPRDFVVLYLLGGLAASLAHVGFNLYLGVDVPALGASGAVMAIVVCCALFYPDHPVLFLLFIPMKLKWVALIFVLFDVLGAVEGQTGGVANAAHLGGALAGFLFWKFDLRFFRARGEAPGGWKRFWRKLFRRHPRMRVVERRAPKDFERPASEALPRVDPETARRVDELLQKISREGQGALSDEERGFLKAASKQYRR